MKNIVMDATLLSSLMSCGRYHDLRFNHRLVSGRGRSNSLEVGSLVHKVLEVFYKHQIGGYPRTACIGQGLAAGQLFITGCPSCAHFTPSDDVPTPKCNHEIDEYPGLDNTPEMSEDNNTGWRFALQTCEQYFDFYKNDAFIPLAAEWVKSEIIYEDSEIKVLWKAKFDLTIDTTEVGILSMDHKTFKQRRAKSSLSNQFMGHCVLLNSRRVIVNKIGLQKTLKIDERLTREIVSLTEDRLDEWRNETVPYYAYKYLQFMEADYWPPDYTHCDNMFGQCMYKPVCEANRNMREEILRTQYTLVPEWDPRNKEITGE